MTYSSVVTIGNFSRLDILDTHDIDLCMLKISLRIAEFEIILMSLWLCHWSNFNFTILGLITISLRKMSIDVEPQIVVDDAQEHSNDAVLADPRQGGHFIDEQELLEWSDESAEEDDEIDEEYDHNRVEDEDWEVAEGGTLTGIEVMSAEMNILQISRNNIIASDNTSQFVQGTRKA